MEHDEARLIYLRGLSEVVYALRSVYIVTFQELEAQRQNRNLDYQAALNSSFIAPMEAESKLAGRIAKVIEGQTFGDLADTVTKFYSDKPLLKDKPVF